MSRQHRRAGFTWVELVVVLLIVVFAMAMLVPWTSSGPATPSTTCRNNLKQWGLAIQNYHEAHREFPPSCGVSHDAAGKITATDGWSWMVHVLPFMEYRALYDRLDVENGRPLIEPDGAAGTPHADVLATVLSEAICPSYSGKPYVTANSKKEAITNYKVMGATHIESLSVATDVPMVPKYDPRGLDACDNRRHPDGAMFPGSTTSLADFADGASHTILLVETVEPRFARWTVGAEATLVGLPRSVEFAAVPGKNYYAPKGFVVGKWGEETRANPEYRTYINWNCEKLPYDGGDGSKSGKYGPSSHHPDVVNHLFGDGSMRGINKDVDPAAYMFGITRAGGDPTPPWFSQ